MGKSLDNPASRDSLVRHDGPGRILMINNHSAKREMAGSQPHSEFGSQPDRCKRRELSFHHSSIISDPITLIALQTPFELILEKVHRRLPINPILKFDQPDNWVQGRGLSGQPARQVRHPSRLDLK